MRNDSFRIGVGVDSFLYTQYSTLAHEFTVHPGSGIFVDGVLNAIGTATDSIVFQSDRIEETNVIWDNRPGLWFGIGLLSGSTAHFEHVCINQATYGIMMRDVHRRRYS